MKDKKSPNKSEYKVGLAFEKIGVKVEYQHPFGPYLLDVFLPKYNACIEINGPHHVVKGRQASDLIRQRYIFMPQKNKSRYPWIWPVRLCENI